MKTAAGRLLLTVPVLASAVILTVSCSAKLYPIPDESSTIRDPSVLVDAIRARQARIVSVSTTGRLETSTAKGTLRTRFTTMAAEYGPDDGHVRLEAWSPSWDLLGSFISDSQGFLYFERGGSSCVSGPSCPANIMKLVPLGLDFGQALGILLGTPPVGDAVPESVRFDRRCGCWKLSMKGPGNSGTEIWADSDGTVRRARYFSGLSTTMNIEFNDIVRSETERFPSTIVIQVKKTSTKSVLRFKDIEINGEIERSDWDLVCPDGLNIGYIDCPAR